MSFSWNYDIRFWNLFCPGIFEFVLEYSVTYQFPVVFCRGIFSDISIPSSGILSCNLEPEGNPGQQNGSLSDLGPAAEHLHIYRFNNSITDRGFIKLNCDAVVTFGTQITTTTITTTTYNYYYYYYNNNYHILQQHTSSTCLLYTSPSPRDS